MSGPLFVLRHRLNGGTATRWGFAVGKKLAPSAVDRNRARRKLRAAVLAVAVRPGEDLVLTLRPAGLRADVARLAAELERQLARAGLTGEKSG